MPSSYPVNIPVILHLAERLAPNSILDVGPGYGKFGFLMRERIDDFQGEVRIDAIEVYSDYNRRASTVTGRAADLYGTIYNNYQYMNFLAAAEMWKQDGQHPPGEGADSGMGPEAIRVHSAPRAEGYDLVLLIDVLEHFNDEDASRVLELAIEIGRYVIISTPVGYEQGPSHGNIHETHLSEWPDDRLVTWASRHGATWVPHVGRPMGTPDSTIGVLHKKRSGLGLFRGR